ncbi:MAG: MerR family transcriptional regulator [Solirubrobacteraceae bacterium]
MAGVANGQDEPEPQGRTMRIGEVAELTGATARTIRYYEEIGLLAGGTERQLGRHRCYSAADVERVNEIVRLKGLLGLSLEQLTTLLEAETARADIRREFCSTHDLRRQRELLQRSGEHISSQLRLVRGRLAELAALERDLTRREAVVREKLRAVDSGADAR